MTVDAPTPGALNTRVQSYLNDVARALHNGKRPDLVDQLKAVTQARREQKPVVVIVGETGRGKSSLINSLLQRPGVDPAGIDVATACPVVFRWAETPGAVARMAADGESREIALDQLAEWVTTDGNPHNERGVHAVVVGLDSELLAAMTLVDTPGAGGLDGGHAELAAAAATTADALIFVVDAGAPIAEPEIRFLERVAERVDDITIVMTKVDQYRGWRVLRDDDRKLLGARVARLADVDIMPVSNVIAFKGSRGDSGLPELERHITEKVAARVGALRFANILRYATTAVGELLRALATRRAYLVDGQGTLAALEADRARLTSLRADPRALLQELDKGLRRFSLDRSDTLNRSIRELRLHYDDESVKAKGDALDALPGSLLADVTALSDQLAEEASVRIGELLAELITRVDAQAPELESLSLLRSPDLAQGVALSAPTRRAATRLERMTTMISFSSGRSIGSLVASLPIFALGGLPFMVAGLGVGGAFAWQMHRGRGDVVRQGEFRTWMREQLAEAERQLNNDFTRAMLDVADEARRGLSDRIDDRRHEIDAMIKDCEAALAKEVSTRAAERQEVDGLIGRIQGLAATGDALRDEVLSGSPGGLVSADG
jgi:GTP-binding protein EngB required for normal cell division